MMSTDDFFSDPAVVELPIENAGCKYDADYFVRVIVDSEDAKLIVHLRDGFAWILEILSFMEIEDDGDECYRCSIHDTKRVRTKRRFRRLVVSILSLIDFAVNNGATLFIRIDEGKTLEESEYEKRKPLFANVASKNVRINTKQLMGVLKEMGARRDLSVCIKVEG